MISNTSILNGKFGIVTTEIVEHFIYQVICKTDEFEIQCFLAETSEENAKSRVYEKYKEKYSINKSNMKVHRLYKSEFKVGDILMVLTEKKELSINDFVSNNQKVIQFLQKLEEISFVNELSTPITDEQVQKNLEWVESLR